jgi:hypothetical protein
MVAAVVTKKRTQGEILRLEPCPAGGEHVLTRPVQRYCDRCRPEHSARALERQHSSRAARRVKAASSLKRATNEGTEALPTVEPTGPESGLPLLAPLLRQIDRRLTLIRAERLRADRERLRNGGNAAMTDDVLFAWGVLISDVQRAILGAEDLRL